MSSSTFVLCLALSMAQIPTFAEQLGDLDALCDRADAIVVGETESWQQVEYSATLVLSVVRSIKGDVPEGTLMSVSAQLSFPTTQHFKGNLRGIWFLKQDGTGWKTLPVYYKMLSLDSGAYVPIRKTAVEGSSGPIPNTIGDKVALEVATALKQGHQDGFDFEILCWTTTMFGQRPFITTLLRDLRAHSNPDLRFIGLSRLLRTEDEPSALVELSTDADLAAKFKRVPFVGGPMCNTRNPDPSVVTALGRISAIPDLEACAAESLAEIHTRQALPFLARLLDSKNAGAREQAIIGFSRFVENFPIRKANDQITGHAFIPQGSAPHQTVDTNRFSLSNRRLRPSGESDMEYVQFWKLWWARTQNNLEGESATQSLK